MERFDVNRSFSFNTSVNWLVKPICWSRTYFIVIHHRDFTREQHNNINVGIIILSSSFEFFRMLLWEHPVNDLIIIIHHWETSFENFNIKVFIENFKYCENLIIERSSYVIVCLVRASCLIVPYLCHLSKTSISKTSTNKFFVKTFTSYVLQRKHHHHRQLFVRIQLKEQKGIPANTKSWRRRLLSISVRYFNGHHSFLRKHSLSALLDQHCYRWRIYLSFGRNIFAIRNCRIISVTIGTSIVYRIVRRDFSVESTNLTICSFLFHSFSATIKHLVILILTVLTRENWNILVTNQIWIKYESNMNININMNMDKTTIINMNMVKQIKQYFQTFLTNLLSRGSVTIYSTAMCALMRMYWSV